MLQIYQLNTRCANLLLPGNSALDIRKNTWFKLRFNVIMSDAVNIDMVEQYVSSVRLVHVQCC